MICNNTDKIFQAYSGYIGADTESIVGYQVAHLKCRDSDDLIVMIPGGSGQICITDESIDEESLILPANLPLKFKKYGISSCVFNSCTELPLRYNPSLPLIDGGDDLLVERHYQQIKEIIEHYSQQYDRVWFFGHSSSATTALGMSNWWHGFKTIVAGIIMVNPKKVFKRPGKNYVPHFGKLLDIPVLAISHAQDGSPNCPLEFNRMLAKCSRNPRSRHVVFDGGIPDGDNDPSLGFGYHGLRGLEQDLVDVIVDFISVPDDR